MGTLISLSNQMELLSDVGDWTQRMCAAGNEYSHRKDGLDIEAMILDWDTPMKEKATTNMSFSPSTASIF